MRPARLYILIVNRIRRGDEPGDKPRRKRQEGRRRRRTRHYLRNLLHILKPLCNPAAATARRRPATYSAISVCSPKLLEEAKSARLSILSAETRARCLRPARKRARKIPPFCCAEELGLEGNGFRVLRQVPSSQVVVYRLGAGELLQNRLTLKKLAKKTSSKPVN